MNPQGEKVWSPEVYREIFERAATVKANEAAGVSSVTELGGAL